MSADWATTGKICRRRGLRIRWLRFKSIECFRGCFQRWILAFACPDKEEWKPQRDRTAGQICLYSTCVLGVAGSAWPRQYSWSCLTARGEACRRRMKNSR